MGLSLGFLNFGRKRDTSQVRAIYDQIVEKARQPAFYATYGVPDTLSGRFDMIVLHSFVFFYRIKNEDEKTKAMGQEIFDTFVEDMDRSLREMGVGYQAVPKRIKKMGEAFYGRVAVYDAILSGESEDELSDALHRNIFAEFEKKPLGAEWMAAYVEAMVQAFEVEMAENLISQPLPSLDPMQFVSE